MKELPIGEADFKIIREKDLLYIDKTAYLYNLIRTGKYYFMSHPRRFGKSLMVNTLAAIFEGEKELFKDLWIYDKIEWVKHPVVSFSFNKIDYKKQDLDTALRKALLEQAEKYEITLKDNTTKEKFSELITVLSKKGPVVVLIDEYDKPILDYLHDAKQSNINRDILKSFFGVLKANDIIGRLHFVFLTGVSKFSKVSIFSELNNLTDLTAHPKYTTLLGITQEELLKDFAPYIKQLAENRQETPEVLLKNIKKWYNGYSWDAKNFVYNPHSLLHLFHTGEFENFWFQSGTTSWLVRNMYQQQVDLENLENKVVFASFFDKFELSNFDPVVLLYQTGYLTIKKIDRTRVKKAYYLDYPNFEVRTSFLEHLFEIYAAKKKSEIGETMIKVETALLNNDLDTFIKLFKVIFADISNRLLKQYLEQDELKLWEAYYHTVIYLTMSLAATETTIQAEVQTNKGYTDAVAETANYVYVMEFKIGTATEAMKQIKAQKYYQKYENSGKQIMLVGIGFSSKERNIDTWLVEKL